MAEYNIYPLSLYYMGDKKTEVIELLKISDNLYATENSDGDGLSIMVGYVDKKRGWRVSCRIATAFIKEDSDKFFPSFVCAIDDLRTNLFRRGLSLKIIYD